MNKLKVKPTSHCLIVEEKIYEAKSKGGIAIPDHLVDQYQNAQNEGIIVAMAADCFDYCDESDRPKLGDVVYFGKYDGKGKKYNNIPFRTLHDTEIYSSSENYIDYNESLYAETNSK